jgi:hypothetical protein
MLLWQVKQGPRFDGLLICSRGCLKTLVCTALRREIDGSGQTAEAYCHRIPLGLLLLSRRSITREQLRGAIASQKAAGHGRLGEWLIRTEAVDEEAVAHALAAQWGVPVLPQDAHPDMHTARLLPRLLMEAFGVLPVRVAAHKILYLAVDEQVDRRLNLGIEKMTGYQVEAIVLKASAYLRLRQAVFEQAAPAVKFYSSGSIASLEDSIADLIAENGAVASRLVRVNQYIWVRVETGFANPDGERIAKRGATSKPEVSRDKPGRQTLDAIFTLPRV